MSANPTVATRAVPIRIPAGVVLGAIVAVAAAVHAVLALRTSSPWIVPDELIYAEVAKSLGDGGLPKIRGEVSFAYGLGYPLLLAPLWAVFDDVTTALAAAKVVNSLVLSLTAVPAYFLARRFVDEPLALVVAALTVAVPSLLYSGTLMTEVLLYPAVVLALLAMTVALEHPSRPAQLAALAAIAVAYAVKPIAGVLAPAFVAAVWLHGALGRGRTGSIRLRLRAYAPTWLCLGLGATGLLGIALVRGSRPHEALGGYSVVLDHMDVGAIPSWVVRHVAELELLVAVVPLAASTVVVVRALRFSNSSSSERLFAALAIPVLGIWLLAVGAFASVPFLDIFEYPENVSRLQGRSTFMLAPLLFVGLALWLRDRRARPLTLVVVGACVTLLPVAIPIGDLDGNVRFQAPPLVPWVEHPTHVEWPFGLLAFTGGLAAWFVLVSTRRYSAALAVSPLLLVFVFVGASAHSSMRYASEWTRSAAWGASPDWVDAAVGPGVEVSVLWAEPPGRPFVDLEPRHRVVFIGEFFNRSLGDVYELGSPLPYALPSTQVRLEGRALLLEDGRPAPLGELVLAPCYVRVAGDRVITDVSTGATVWRVADPPRAVVADPTSCSGGVS